MYSRLQNRTLKDKWYLLHMMTLYSRIFKCIRLKIIHNYLLMDKRGSDMNAHVLLNLSDELMK